MQKCVVNLHAEMCCQLACRNVLSTCMQKCVVNLHAEMCRQLARAEMCRQLARAEMCRQIMCCQLCVCMCVQKCVAKVKIVQICCQSEEKKGVIRQILMTHYMCHTAAAEQAKTTPPKMFIVATQKVFLPLDRTVYLPLTSCPVTSVTQGGWCGCCTSPDSSSSARSRPDSQEVQTRRPRRAWHLHQSLD
jgi:hypothetical protein